MTADYTPRLEYDASCELPEPHAAYWNPAHGVFTDCRLFTADQMRAYAAQAVTAKDAEIERLKSTVLELQSGYKKIADASDSQMRDGDLAREIADRMRAPTKPFLLEESPLTGDDRPEYTARDMLQAVAAERTRMRELHIQAMRALEAWDGTVLPASQDGMMQERMECLRAALDDLGTGGKRLPVQTDNAPPKPFSLEGNVVIGDISPKYTARDMLQAVAAERERWSHVFDGMTVLNALTPEARKRIGYAEVSDVLDAVAKLSRA